MSEHLKKALVLLVALAPPSGALAALWPKVEAHPYRAAALTVAYWVGVFVVGVLAKVWKDELERDVVKAVATWLREAFLHLVSPFRREYLQRIVYDHRTFNVRGLRTTGAHALELDQVFVELRIASSGSIVVRCSTESRIPPSYSNYFSNRAKSNSPTKQAFCSPRSRISTQRQPRKWQDVSA